MVQHYMGMRRYAEGGPVEPPVPREAPPLPPPPQPAQPAAPQPTVYSVGGNPAPMEAPAPAQAPAPSAVQSDPAASSAGGSPRGYVHPNLAWFALPGFGQAYNQGMQSRTAQDEAAANQSLRQQEMGLRRRELTQRGEMNDLQRQGFQQDMRIKDSQYASWKVIQEKTAGADFNRFILAGDYSGAAKYAVENPWFKAGLGLQPGEEAGFVHKNGTLSMVKRSGPNEAWAPLQVGGRPVVYNDQQARASVNSVYGSQVKDTVLVYDKTSETGYSHKVLNLDGSTTTVKGAPPPRVPGSGSGTGSGGRDTSAYTYDDYLKYFKEFAPGGGVYEAMDKEAKERYHYAFGFVSMLRQFGYDPSQTAYQAWKWANEGYTQAQALAELRARENGESASGPPTDAQGSLDFFKAGGRNPAPGSATAPNPAPGDSQDYVTPRGGAVTQNQPTARELYMQSPGVRDRPIRNFADIMDRLTPDAPRQFDATAEGEGPGNRRPARG